MKFNVFAVAIAALVYVIAVTHDRACGSRRTVREARPSSWFTGPYADGSSWSKVIALLQARGYHCRPPSRIRPPRSRTT